MASPVSEAKNKHTAGGFTEVVGRGKGWLKSKNPTTGKFALTTQVGNVGWHRGNGPFTEADEVDTDWQPTTGTWDYEMTQADYQAYIDTAGNYRYADFVTGEYVNLNVTFFGWTNDEGQSQQIPFYPVSPSVSADILTWDALFGTGTALKIQTQTARLAKFIDVDSLSNLPAPTIGGTNIQLTLSYTLSRSGGVAIYADGELWDENGTITTAQNVEFRQISSGTGIWWFEVPKAWDSSTPVSSVQVGTQTLKKAGANLFVDAHIPYSWIASAAFPITVDPSVTPQVSASADDAYSDSSQNVASTSGTDLYIGDGQIAASPPRAVGFRFQVNASGTCDLAYIEVCNKYGTTVDLPITHVADDVDNASAWSTSGNVYTQTTHTTANVSTQVSKNYPQNAFTRLGSDSIDIKTVVQEIFDRAGWSSGQYMRFAVYGNRVQDYRASNFYPYDSNTSYAAKIYIEYTESGGTDVLTASDLTASAPTLDTQNLYEATFLRPSSDISAGAWEDQLGGNTDLYSRVDEVNIDDADYIHSEDAPSSSQVELGLQTGIDPSLSLFHIVRFRYRKLGSGTVNLTFYLMQGTTQIATWTRNNISSSFLTDEYILSTSEADSITDYTNLRIRVEASEV